MIQKTDSSQFIMPGWWNGRHTGFKILRCEQRRASSSLALGTISRWEKFKKLEKGNNHKYLKTLTGKAIYWLKISGNVVKFRKYATKMLPACYQSWGSFSAIFFYL